MPIPIPVPDELDKPFFDAAKQHKLVIQYCTRDNLWQFPPRATCNKCRQADKLEWRETSGRGKILTYCQSNDTRVVALKSDMPYNIAVITLEEDEGIQFYSHLPGVALDEVPMGRRVKVTWQDVGEGMVIPEWEYLQP